MHRQPAPAFQILLSALLSLVACGQPAKPAPTETNLAAYLPDPGRTPGMVDTGVTQANIQQTICVSGYTKTVRPPSYYTSRLKRKQLDEYGHAGANMRDYEEDHLVPLALGGAPAEPRNLWPEPRNGQWGADKKDALERKLYDQVCAGQMPLEDAQAAMASNWIAAYQKYVED